MQLRNTHVWAAVPVIVLGWNEELPFKHDPKIWEAVRVDGTLSGWFEEHPSGDSPLWRSPYLETQTLIFGVSSNGSHSTQGGVFGDGLSVETSGA